MLLVCDTVINRYCDTLMQVVQEIEALTQVDEKGPYSEQMKVGQILFS